MDEYFFTDNSLEDYLNNVGKIPLLTADEEKKLGYLILDGDEAAVSEMVTHNLKYVVSIAKWYMNFGLPLQDLIQEGNIGLIEAARTFDVTKGNRFSTYARDRIMQKIEIGIANTSRNIRIPYYKFRKVMKYIKTKDKLTVELNREPLVEEIAKEMNEDINKIKTYEALLDDTLSLNYMLDDSDNFEFGDMVSSDRNVEDELFKDDLPNEIKALFEAANLSDLDIEIIKRKFGFDDQEVGHLEAIASEYNKTGMWAHYRIVKALKKMKNTKYFKDTFY